MRIRFVSVVRETRSDQANATKPKLLSRCDSSTRFACPLFVYPVTSTVFLIFLSCSDLASRCHLSLATQASDKKRERTERRHSGQVPDNDFVIPQNDTSIYVGTGGNTTRLTVAYRLAEDSTRFIAAVEARGFYEDENGNTSNVPFLRSLDRATQCKNCTVGVESYKEGGT